MTKAIVVEEIGGPDKLVWKDHELARPGPNQLLVRQRAAGLNFIDVYFRKGVYKAPRLPFVPGKEGAGTVVAVGEGVTGFKVGDRVAYAGGEGTYAHEALVPAAQALHLPDAIDEETAAAIMLKGMTAEYLLRRTFKVGPDTVLLFHAAAGGVGVIATQWAKHLGATVIGTAGSPEKCAEALAHGCDHVINYRTDDFVEAVKDLTRGRKCDVVYDSVGRDTFPGSLDCLKRQGLFVSFGQSSGTIENFDLALLNQKGSLFATRPSLYGYTATREELEASARSLFKVVGSGAVKIEIKQSYPVEEARRAHEDLESRRTSGLSVITIQP
ncbi:quinone oxidoreductase family protein [Aureimonas frigidaquae]|uniref:Quinone oxidoreductase n=1 Tax=Aureimonas frigidaquae TaxID=424757 RepID=A0A0N7KY03_9HYPH|nr:quinone oxidoreductase [Aureimonas frigidaquae]BAT28361.1 quinone oxidoreductase [Aureimonas frigidaquae]